jgi:hypothetical protein
VCWAREDGRDWGEGREEGNRRKLEEIERIEQNLE